MWHAFASVNDAYDPILYESAEPASVLVLNAGPGTVLARAWSQLNTNQPQPQVEIQMRPGDQRVLAGLLVRTHLSGGVVAAVGWRILS